MVHGHFLQMGGFNLSCSTDEMQQNRITNLHQAKRNGDWEGVLLEHDFKRLVRSGRLDMPTITEEQINDKSKGDAFSKGVALLQSIWFIIQIVTRHFQNLAITELELTTLALVALNSVMYICWWYKPLSVEKPIVLTPRRLCLSIALPAVMSSVEDIAARPVSSPGLSTCSTIAQFFLNLWSGITSFFASIPKLSASARHWIKRVTKTVTTSVASQIKE